MLRTHRNCLIRLLLGFPNVRVYHGFMGTQGCELQQQVGTSPGYRQEPCRSGLRSLGLGSPFLVHRLCAVVESLSPI